MWAMTQPVTSWQTSGCLLQKDDCLPKRKRFVPTVDKEQEGCGHQQNVSVFWQNNRPVMAFRFVGGDLVL